MRFKNGLIAPEHKVMKLLDADGNLIYENPDYYWDGINSEWRIKPGHEKTVESKIKWYDKIGYKYDAIASEANKGIQFYINNKKQ